jgi:hypothetical protein
MNLERPIAKHALQRGADPEVLEQYEIPDELAGRVFFGVVSPQEFEECAQILVQYLARDLFEKKRLRDG